MKYVEAPNEVYGVEYAFRKKLFLAGGITNCPDWQSDFVKFFSKEKNADKYVVYNPRRKNFPIEDPNASDEQIAWEYDKLKNSDVILFWFSKGSLNPIVLYELGRWGNSDILKRKQIFVGIDPGYERTQDVIIQTKLSHGPDFKFFDNLKQLSRDISNSYSKFI
jgi:hypothetical protein